MDFRRFSLTDHEGEVAASDLLLHVAGHKAPLRLDDVPEADPFPRTQSRMKSLGLRSLLAIPLSSAGGPEGAVILARTFGWAFAGAPLRFLCPVVSMTGLCLERALALTALKKEIEHLREKSPRKPPHERSRRET